MNAINGTGETVEARVVLTVMLEPGESLRDALVRAVERGRSRSVRSPGPIVDEICALLGLDSSELPC